MTKAIPLPSIKVVQEIIDYDPLTGLFTWKQTRGGRVAGTEAGCIDTSGYRRIAIHQRKYQAQRLAWLLATGNDPGEFHVDHINSDPTDNSLSNLRLANNKENACNRGAPRNSKSGYKGVRWRSDKKRWNAQIQSDGVKYNLGYFDTPEQAYAAYCAAAQKMHGDFSKT